MVFSQLEGEKSHEHHTLWNSPWELTKPYISLSSQAMAQMPQMHNDFLPGAIAPGKGSLPTISSGIRTNKLKSGKDLERR